MKRILQKFIFLFFPLLSFAQLAKTDSFMVVLAKEKQDTNKVNTLNSFTSYLIQTNHASAIIYSDSIINLSAKISFPKGIAFGYQIKGAALQLSGKYEQALKVLNEGITKAKPFGETKGLGNLYVRTGYAMVNLGKKGEAIPYYKTAEEIYFNLKQYALESDAFLGEGAVYASLGEYEKAIACYIKSREAAEKADAKEKIGFTYIMSGNAFEAQNDLDHALENFQKSLPFFQQSNSSSGIPGAYVSIGNVYYFKYKSAHEQKNKVDAEKYLNEAKKNYQLCLDIRLKQNDKSGMAQVNEDLANVMMEDSNYTAALNYYLDGLNLFRSLGDSSSVTGSLNNVGEVYFALKQYDKSESAFLNSLSLCHKYGYSNWKGDAYSGIAKLYFAMGKFEKAYLYKDSLQQFNAKMTSEENAKQAKDLEEKYQNRKNEERISNLNELNAAKDVVQQKQKQIIIFISCGLGIVLLLSFFLVRINAERKKANSTLADQNKIIAEKNKDITDSINYASRIQKSVMPDEKILKENVSDYFIFNRPRDIVSGDFFWLAKKEERIYIAVADCTGHGVPGALVSVVGINMLNKIIENSSELFPAQILEQLHSLVISALNKDTSARDSNDGMDIGLLCIDKKNNSAFFSGAGRPLYYSDKNGLHFIKGDRYSIAGEKKIGDAPFSETKISLNGEMSFYLSSDGYVDQFGEATRKKFLSKKFQETLSVISNLPMKEQGMKVENAFLNWKGKVEQVDDVMVIGVRV